MTLLTTCTGDGPSSGIAAQGSTTLGLPPADPTTTTTSAQPVVRRIGEPFTVGDARLTLLSVQDPFPAPAQLQPRAGHRMLSIRYEAVSLRADPLEVSELPSVEIRDSTGGTYRSEHGRLSVVAGSRAPGEPAGGHRMESSAMFEVPASATGLRVTFRSVAAQDDRAVVVSLD